MFHNYLEELQLTKRFIKAEFDAIVVFIDTFYKMVHLAPTKTSATAPDTAHLFFDHVVKLHGLPKSIVSDRDAKFTSKFWKSVFHTLGTKLAMSTAFHPRRMVRLNERIAP